MEKTYDALRAKVREADGRDSEPSAALVDSQPVRAADTVAKEISGYAVGRKTKGHKRFIVTDALGRTRKSSASSPDDAASRSSPRGGR